MRAVMSVTVKRKHIDLTKRDRYGHWWFEIGDPRAHDSESYGWWPKHDVGLKDTLRGSPGELNGQTTYGGEPTRDPHHGDGSADQAFHPLVAADDPRTDSEIADCLRRFARSFKGEWRWTFGKGQNCHTFQSAALEHCRLHAPPAGKG